MLRNQAIFLKPGQSIVEYRGERCTFSGYYDKETQSITTTPTPLLVCTPADWMYTWTINYKLVKLITL